MAAILSSQICVLQFCFINCETLVVKNISLVYTRTFENNPKNSDKGF